MGSALVTPYYGMGSCDACGGPAQLKLLLEEGECPEVHLSCNSCWDEFVRSSKATKIDDLPLEMIGPLGPEN